MIRSLRARTRPTLEPTRVSSVTARAVARHVVRLSGKLELDLCAPFRVRHHLGLPECRVLELLADRQLGILPFVLEISELESPAILRQIDGIVAGRAGEIVGDGEVGLHLIVAMAVKALVYVHHLLGPNAVDRFVHDAQTDFRSGGGRAVGVAREHGVRGRLARLVLVLVRDDLKTEQLIARGHFERAVRRVHLVVFDKGDAQINVRRVARFNRHVDHHGATGSVKDARRQHALHLGRHQQMRFVVGSIASTCAVSPG